MFAKQTSAILLKRYRLSETSLILLWLTQDYGKIKTTARGALKGQNPFSSCGELFGRATISFSVNKKSDLHFLKEAVPVPSFPQMPSTYSTLLCASYFAELCDLFTEPWAPVPEIFELLERAFLFLKKQPPTLRAVAHFEKSLAKALGIYVPEIIVDEALRTLVPSLPANREVLLKLLVKVESSPNIS